MCKIVVACNYCGKEYPEKRYRVLDQTRRNYCSRSCYAEGRKVFCRRPLAERFWEKVRITEDDGCWLWIGQTDHKGYGVISVGGRDGSMVHSQRVAWELAIGPVPEGIFVLHSCDNPPCVRPDHLFLGTNAANMQDKVAKGRQQKGERVHNSRLTETEVIEIRRRYAAREANQATLAAEFHVDRVTISNVLSGRTWKHLLTC